MSWGRCLSGGRSLCFNVVCGKRDYALRGTVFVSHSVAFCGKSGRLGNVYTGSMYVVRSNMLGIGKGKNTVR